MTVVHNIYCSLPHGQNKGFQMFLPLRMTNVWNGNANHQLDHYIAHTCVEIYDMHTNTIMPFVIFK